MEDKIGREPTRDRAAVPEPAQASTNEYLASGGYSSSQTGDDDVNALPLALSQSARRASKGASWHDPISVIGWSLAALLGVLLWIGFFFWLGVL